jgi:Protein of unknown function (DUF3892)
VALYVITCVIKSDETGSTNPAPGCNHITDVGFSNGAKLSVKQVYEHMDAGDEFVSRMPTVTVGKFNCLCRAPTLKTHADGVPNNNLDNLGHCA